MLALMLSTLSACLPPDDPAGESGFALLDGGPGAVDLGTNRYGSCAVTGQGELFCWGGLPVDGGVVTVAGVARVGGLRAPVTEVELGEQILCARYVDGAVACWDDRALDVSDAAAPTLGDPGLVYADADTFDVGQNALLHVDAAGAAWAQWWVAEAPPLGEERVADHVAVATLGLTDHRYVIDADGRLTGTASVDFAALPPVTGVWAGPDGACALDADGTPWCWDTTGPAVSVPAAVPEVTGAVELTVGSDRCARDAAGDVRCWDVTANPDGLDLSGLPPMVALSGDGTHSCGIDADGAVWCWGGVGWGGLGDGEAGLGPVHVPGFTAE